MRQAFLRKPLLIVGLLILVAGLAFAVRQVAAHTVIRPVAQVSPIHPTFALLDEDGENVLETGEPVSTMQTCGQCHDTQFIEGHSFHADLGLSDFTDPGQTTSGRPWDTSPGLFGKWNPLTYRYLSSQGDERIDLGTADWLKLFGARHAGGGPGATSRGGLPLANLPADSANPETVALDPQTGQPATWDWAESGVVEMNCFLCHFSQPNNEARTQALQDGQFRWASTATLLGTGIVEGTASGWQWVDAAFDENGELAQPYISIQDPTNENCAQCHGVVHTDLEQPLALTGCNLEDWQTATTGQVISPQKIAKSGVNLSGKDDISRSWDIHAERGLNCTDCHYSLNNPVHYQENGETRPGHLQYDPRRLEIGEYLEKPDHQFARGQSAQFTVAPELKATMRRCEACHDAVSTHDWLPYAERHMDELACESCHVPQLYAPAVQQVDWTTISADGQPIGQCRGLKGDSGTLKDLITGFQPVLMPRQNVDGDTLLAPYNLVSAWYWVYEDAAGNTRPVRLEDLQAAWLQDGQYSPEVVAAFDQDSDGSLNESELSLDTAEKQALIAARLEALGLRNPHIAGEVQPYSVNHNVAAGEWAIQDCKACHNDTSRVTQPIQLASYLPGGVMPEFVKDANTIANGSLYLDDGALFYQPATHAQKLYIFGHTRISWLDWLGALLFVGVLVGVAGHGTYRFYSSLRAPRNEAHLEKVYMYSVYERFWHWLQTFVIILLLFTGLIIHRPDIFGFFNFRNVVMVHNVLAALLVANAGLALFYHLASGEIRQFIPRPYGFFDQAIVQAKYYLGGIFKGSSHPFEKSPQKKLNPLQQATYFAILNVLLPLQILTGALMWGVQRWPGIANLMGGLPFLAPFHSLVAWLFAAFIVAHVYLTTTGHEPLTSVRAMMNGWDEVEVETAKEETAISTPEEEIKDDHTGDVQAQGAQPEGNPV